MGNSIPQEKIIKHITSQGRECALEMDAWINESGENKEIYQEFQTIWQISGAFPLQFSPNRSKAWQKIEKHIHSQKRRYFVLSRIGQVAAAVLIMFMCIWVGTEVNDWIENEQYTEVVSPAGQKTRILLPDSSVVLLNGNSKIRYSQNFNKNNRNIDLEGEGYFNVHKNLSKQFIVNTSELQVKVFGTSFNVKAYGEDQDIQVGLRSGSVRIDRNENKLTQLRPGEMGTFDKKQHTIQVAKVDLDLVSAWTRDEIVFEEESLQEIVEYLERWYGVEIKVDSQLLDGELFTFKVKTESLNELLKLINLLKPIDYHIDGKKVIINKL